jgi:hypothetical protein
MCGGEIVVVACLPTVLSSFVRLHCLSLTLLTLSVSLCSGADGEVVKTKTGVDYGRAGIVVGDIVLAVLVASPSSNCPSKVKLSWSLDHT